MSQARALNLSERLMAVNQELIDLVLVLEPKQWRLPAASDDGGERRPVGVVAYHVASSTQTIAARVLTVAKGGELVPLGDIDERNRRQAEEHATATVAEVVSMLRDHGAAAVEMLRGLTDVQLERSVTLRIGEMSAEQMAERVLIGHARAHLESIRKAVEAAG